tara:strand:- start:544 stop:909 length:366 start_codon:yes stop_codon:yes gene_type:complete
MTTQKILNEYIKNLDNTNINESTKMALIVKKGLELEKLELTNNKEKRELMLQSFTTYTLQLLYKEEQENGLFYEEIILEGYENAINILNAYRKIGHNIKLKSLYLTGGNEDTKVKKVTFKY